jgi:HJR/Mrr/RecB family endonuclease
MGSDIFMQSKTVLEINKKGQIFEVSAQEKKVKHTSNPSMNREDLASEILNQYSDKITKFLEITYRKVVTTDDYGDENQKALQEEIVRFLKKIDLLNDPRVISPPAVYHRIFKKKSKVFDFPEATLISQMLSELFQKYYLDQKSKESHSAKSDIDDMSGIDFEHFIIQLLKKCGVVNVSGTKASGDQGADVIFMFKDIKVVIQAKRYTGSVGNTAIQEVYAAKGFYKCDVAWVITNSNFTSNANSLAQKLDVFLIDGTDLSRFESKFSDYFATKKMAG